MTRALLLTFGSSKVVSRSFWSFFHMLADGPQISRQIGCMLRGYGDPALEGAIPVVLVMLNRSEGDEHCVL